MSGKSRRSTKRRRQGSNTVPVDVKRKVTQTAITGCGLHQALPHHFEADENTDTNGTVAGVSGSRQSGLYGDGERSVASRHHIVHRGAPRTFPITSSRSSRATTDSRGASNNRQKPSFVPTSSRSIASNPTTRNLDRASISRSRNHPPRPYSAATSCSAASVRSSTTACRSRTAYATQRPAVHIVCAIGENVARETCVASLDAGTPISLQVTKQGNGQTYAETMAYLEMLKPHEILLNEGRKNSPLARKIMQLYELSSENYQTTTLTEAATRVAGTATATAEDQTVVKFISRSYFDQTKGAELLRRLARTDTFDPTLVEEYILLSATHALLHYTQQMLGAFFSRKCLHVNLNSGGKNRMIIDRSTLLQLELLINAKTGKTQNSLVSSIDCTKTTVGTRLLRTTIMAPPCRSDTINARLDLVDSFLEDEEFFYAILEHLRSLPAVDKMLTDVALVPKLELKKAHASGQIPVVTARLASKGIAALVCIKSTLGAMPVLVDVLQEYLKDSEVGVTADGLDDEATALTGRSSLLVGLGGGPASKGAPKRNYLLRAIIQALSQPQLDEIRDHVSEVFTESTKFCRNANAMRHHECFALKSKENGMMEILRKAFVANVDDIYKKADEYAEIYGIHVSVRYSSTRGYYLSVPADIGSSLPNIFIQPIKSGNHIYCTTEEVHSLNIRAQDNVQDLLLMTYERIQEVLADARSKYDALAALSDAIALLDLCHGFADNVTLSRLPWSRPILVGETSNANGESNNSAILIRNGRYGIDVSNSYLSSADGPKEIIPNDTYASDKKPFTVISGINGSGKSTYLKQIAIIVLLAHCGSYVPAEQATIPLRNRLCARMGTADDQENNISSFMLEMKETAFLCSNASDKSLIILDELGRATSNEDGVTIAWAVSEFLLKKGAMTFLATHYPQLCQLSQIYPSVQNQHLHASISTEGNKEVRYSHKLKSGPCTASPDYGVEMADSCGWPADVVDDARRIKLNLRDNLHENEICQDPDSIGADADAILARKRFLKKLSRNLLQIVQNETSIVGLRSKLQRLCVAASRNPEMPIDVVRQYLTTLLVESHCQIDQNSISHFVPDSAKSNEKVSIHKAATFIGAENVGPHVTAPDESCDQCSLTSRGSFCGSA